MKVRVKKQCKIEGVPAIPGEVYDVPEARAKALTDNDYAELVEPPKKANSASEKKSGDAEN